MSDLLADYLTPKPVYIDHNGIPVLKVYKPKYKSRKAVLHEATRRKSQRLKSQGELVPPGNCDQCRKLDDHLTMHHPDYHDPKRVVWLCTPCHIAEHRKEI